MTWLHIAGKRLVSYYHAGKREFLRDPEAILFERLPESFPLPTNGQARSN